MKSHNLPLASILPVSTSRCGVQSGANFSRGPPCRKPLLLLGPALDTWMMPSSSKRWKAFLSVSLLTASKYDRSPWW